MHSIKSLLFGALLLAIPSAVDSRTWHVTVDGLGDAPTIQAAIDSSAAGDSVLVGQGTYHERLILARDRILIGSWNPSFTESDVDQFQTVVDADSGGPCVTAVFESEPDTSGLLAGLRLIKGIGVLRDGYTRGGGVHAYGFRTIRDCIVQDNFAEYGGGIFIQDDFPTLTRVRIVGNSAAQGGGGIQIVANETGLVDGGVIDGNVLVDHGEPLRGAGLLASGRVCTVLDTSVLNNDGYAPFTPSFDGLGIYSDCDSMAIVESFIYDNGSRSVIGSAKRMIEALHSSRFRSGPSRGVDSAGGGVFMLRGLMRSCIVDANGTGGYDEGSLGGGIWIGHGVIENCVISRNSANANEGFGSGGGVYGGNLTIRNSIIRRNHGGGSFGGAGGGVAASVLQMENCAVVGNWATCSFSITNSVGGGVSGGQVLIRNSTIAGNRIGLYVQGQGCGVRAGGGLIENCIIANNTAPMDDFEGYPDTGGILGPVVSRYNLFYANEGYAYQGIVDSTAHVHANPLIAVGDTLSFNLLLHSPAIDRGDPAILDPDGSRSDIGAYGGLGAIMSQPTRVAGAQGSASGYGVGLSWNDVPAPDLSGYAVYRAPTSGVHPGLETLLELPAGTEPSYTDRFAFPGSTYFYRVSAYDDASYGGGYSDEIASTAVPWMGGNGFGATSTVFGTGGGHQFGAAVLAADLNGDDIDDLIASSPGHGNGRVLVFWGGASFAPITELNADVIILAPRSGEDFGWVLSTGNVTGDGTEDLLIGASRASPLGRGNAGAVYIIEGKTNWPASPVTINLAAQSADKTILGAAAEDRTGSSLTAGDYNDDQGADLAIGSPEHITPAGARDGEVRILYSISATADTIDLAASPMPFTVIHSDSAGLFSGDRFGSALASGDVSGDGIDDLVVGSRGEDPAGKSAAGVVHVIEGHPDIDQLALIDLAVTSASLRVEGASADDQLGSAVAVLDLDGNGMSEIVAGAPTAKRPDDLVAAGAVYVIRAADVNGSVLTLDTDPAWISLYGSTAGDLYGSAIAMGRTAGAPESHLWAGARGAITGRGEATALWGGRTTYPGVISLEQSAMDWKVEGPASTGGASTSLLGGAIAMGDFDGQGTLDVAAGAFGADLGIFLDAGIVTLVLNEDATDVEEPVVAQAAIDRLQLSMRGRNPCRDRAEFALALPRDGAVELSVYDISGRRVWNETQELSAGLHEVAWDGQRENGARSATGVFLVKAQAGDESSTQRIVLVR